MLGKCVKTGVGRAPEKFMCVFVLELRQALIEISMDDASSGQAHEQPEDALHNLDIQGPTKHTYIFFWPPKH
eukprot:1355882-Amphidinium_carterae.1